MSTLPMVCRLRTDVQLHIAVSLLKRDPKPRRAPTAFCLPPSAFSSYVAS